MIVRVKNHRYIYRFKQVGNRARVVYYYYNSYDKLFNGWFIRENTDLQRLEKQSRFIYQDLFRDKFSIHVLMIAPYINQARPKVFL